MPLVRHLFMALSITLFASAHAQSLRDGISFHTLQDIRDGTVDKCPVLYGAAGEKVYHENNSGPPLTDEEYRELAGDAELFALQGDAQFYSRSAKKILPMLEAYLTSLGYDLSDPTIYGRPEVLSSLQSFSPDKLSGDIPVLCGDGRIEKEQAESRERERLAREEYERNCKLCRLPGGYYLDAIYEGDFDKQNELAAKYIYDVISAGGAEVMMLGVLINNTGGQKTDFTYLEDVVGYYMLSSSRKWRNKPQCYPSGVHKVTFTTEYPDQVYETVGGVYLGRDEGYTNVTEYAVSPALKSACDKICNKNGGILLTARLAQGFGKKLDAVEAFRSVDRMLSEHACDSDVVRQFERNLVDMWERENSQPSNVRRNTIGDFFR